MSTKYLASPELLSAREVAEYLNRPLLLSGEPGTGKTKFAFYVSEILDKQLFIFNTKSTSLSRDLFYTYDAIGHFAEKEKNILEFINLEALGRAIVNAYGLEKIKKKLLNEITGNSQLEKLRKLNDAEKERIVENFVAGCDGCDSIVLIDEVDKAPRDFPNDILNEIENIEFEIRELNLKISLNKESKETRDKIFVILTSNFEKNLPEAFLRRCIYHHIEFIEDVDNLVKIISLHVSDADSEQLKERIAEMISIRKDSSIQKKPATSEMIDCIKWLSYKNGMANKIQENRAALSTLLKKSEDIKSISTKPVA
ncbi:MAG: MoxR family ATPase [Ferruginibacter sp.]|nr:MoxR family ATPase [Ferruginibacter sp.]